MKRALLLVGLLSLTAPAWAAPGGGGGGPGGGPAPDPCATTCESLGRECGAKPSCPAQSCGTCAVGLSCSAAGLCFGTAPTVNLTPFDAGALIIPMDTCYNPPVAAANTETKNDGTGCVVPAGAPTCYGTYTNGGIRLPFGLLYLLLQNHIPVSILLNPYKTSLTDADFTVTGGLQNGIPSTVATVTYVKRSGTSYVADATKVTCGTNTVTYGGMPFVVEAAYASQALSVIAAYSSANSGLFDEVPLHVINYSFQAPLKLKLGGPPKPVLISAAPLDTYFEESEADTVSPSNSTYTLLKGSSPADWYYEWPVATFGAHPACPGGKCTSLTYSTASGTRRIVDVIWTENGKLNAWSEMPPFLSADGTALVVADASTWEAQSGGGVGGTLASAGGGAQKGPYCPAVVSPAPLKPFTNPGQVGVDYPSSNIYLQLGGIDLFTHGNGGGDGSMYKFSGFPAAHTHALASEDNLFYSVISGHPIISGTQVKGDVVYLGSLNSWHGNAGNKDAGLHIMYNTLLTAGEDTGSTTDPPNGYFVGTELTRSNPVGKLTGQVYLGSFDWKIPELPTAGGNLYYSPSQTTYPYMTGHFREYTNSVVGANSLVCDPATNGALCAWDLAKNIPAWNGRRAFVAYGASGSYTLLTAASQAADSTVAYIGNNIGTKLGGVDYATGAVIEGKGNGSLVTIANAGTRPTVAYVGARDGFLHAVCADANCYGYTPGTELWAVLPMGTKAQITSGITNKDFRAVNVGGAIRVGDFQDTFFGQAASYRTVLIAGTRESGHVFAMDISNPNPANFNQDGFRYMWEQDGTSASGVTGERMGPTLGATIAAKGTTGYAIVTSARQSGVAPGINTYVLRLTDGKVIGFNQKLYTRAVQLASGNTSPLPNNPPPLATVIDADDSGDDETILVSDHEGVVRKLRLNIDGTLQSTTVVAVDASSSCANGIACQPIGVSASVGRDGAGNLVAYVGTGGADFARVPTLNSKALGFKIGAPGQSSTSFFSQNLGTITLPTGSAPANVSLTWPLRSYAQLTIAGTDLYAVATTLSVGDAGQLALPLQFPGIYGQVLRWGGLDSTIGSTPTALIGANGTFSGGASSVIAMNTAGGQGSLALVGSGEIVRIAAPSTSLGSSAYSVRKSSSGGSRPFTVQTWIDLVD